MFTNDNSLTTASTESVIKHNSLNTQLISNYHSNEINQNNKIINTAIGVIIVGTVAIIGSIFIAIFTSFDVGLLTAIAGILIDFISATIFWMVTKSNDNKLKYFNSISSEEERNKIISLIETTKDEKAKIKLIEKMVDSYCKCKESR